MLTLSSYLTWMFFTLSYVYNNNNTRRALYIVLITKFNHEHDYLNITNNLSHQSLNQSRIIITYCFRLYSYRNAYLDSSSYFWIHTLLWFHSSFFNLFQFSLLFFSLLFLHLLRIIFNSYHKKDDKSVSQTTIHDN